MDLFVIGDVHGCYYTLQKLLQHWQPEREILIQVGDLVDRGNYAPETVALALDLSTTYPDRTVFLKGNHEAGMLRYYGPAGPYQPWLSWGGNTTVAQYEDRPALLETHLAWLQQRPLWWENNALLITHAGLADTPNPLDEDNPDGILWRRGPLLNIGKRQVIGHTPSTDGKIRFDEATNTLNLDTAAVYGRCLTGAKLSATGEILAVLPVPTFRTDSSRCR